MPSFQQQIPDNHCFGCGPHNPQGLHLQSYWLNGEEGLRSTCSFQPANHHNAGPQHFVNGGIIATVIDCHAICTAIARAYHDAGRSLGEPDENGEVIWFATGGLSIRYLKPALLAVSLNVEAVIREVKPKKITLDCTVKSAGQLCAEAEVVAVRVPPVWLKPPGSFGNID
ncbi:MAG: PaaI family thioesterase [Pseudomonadales bacterium]|nr:PaaI family thioesterase [Pseudomonadales bacterium]